MCEFQHFFFWILYSFEGLDPAGPGYTFPFDIGRNERLDPSDAKYVQCIYTSRATFGTLKDIGHGNFIANGGAFQPGCFSLICSHSRVTELFNQSLVPSNQFIGEQCSNWIVYLLAKFLYRWPCSAATDQLGIYSKRITGTFFINTNAEPPYAKVQLSKNV